MHLKSESERIARKLGPTHETQWASLRDAVDIESGGELDAWQLDKLTDEVARLIEFSRVAYLRSSEYRDLAINAPFRSTGK